MSGPDGALTMRSHPRGGGKGRRDGQAVTGSAGRTSKDWKCVVVGHRIRFRSQNRLMTWSCEWCGGRAGSKAYESAAAASRYARAFDHRDSQDAGKRAPLLGMFPLRLWRFLRNRKERSV